MRKIIILSFSILLIQAESHAFSGWVDSIIKYIEGFNDQSHKGINQQDRECLDCEVSAAAQSDNRSYMQQCVERICPNEDYSINRIYENTYRNDVQENKVYKEEVQPLINRLMLTISSEKKKEANNILKYANSDAVIDQGNQLTFISSLQMFDVLPEDTSSFFSRDDEGNRIINEEAIREALPEKYKDKAKFWGTIYKVFVESYPAILDYQRISLLDAEELKVRVDLMLKETKDKILSIADEPGLSILKEEAIFSRILSEGYTDTDSTIENLDEYDYNELVSYYASSAFMYDVLQYDYIQNFNEGRSINVSSLATEEGLNYLNRIVEHAESVHRDLSLLKGNYRSSNCETAFSRMLEFPSQEEVDSYSLEGVKENFKNVIKTNMSNQSFNHISNTIDNEWYASKTKSREEKIREFIQGLEKLYKEERESSDIERSQESLKFSAAYELNSLKNEDKDPAEYVASSLDQYCEGFSPSLVPDAAMRHNGRFIIGPMSIRFPQEARGIIYHEMGHLLDHQLKQASISRQSRMRHEQVNLCLQRNHSYLSPKERESLIKDGEFRYQSEDFSDLVAALASGTNKSCYMRRSYDHEKYEEMSLDRSDKNSVHSSRIFRLLHVEQIQKGSLPEVCDLALNEKGQRANFRNCYQQ